MFNPAAVLDDGHITDARGRKIDFKNTIIIMTSNSEARNISPSVWALEWQATPRRTTVSEGPCDGGGKTPVQAGIPEPD